ncbi:MAG: DNA-3-methyladenine glycosylase, partial [Bacteroidota bacterium]
MKLDRSFYEREDVVTISRELLGKVLFSRSGKTITAGIITETEAYAGITDKASHAWNNRRTERTKIMYETGGISYVYLCYGIHHLFNVVTNKKDIPHAILIRALSPLEGIKTMQTRRGKNVPKEKLCSGPGSLSVAMNISVKDTGKNLLGDRIWIEDTGIKINHKEISITPRIGVDYAGEDAKLPYR